MTETVRCGVAEHRLVDHERLGAGWSSLSRPVRNDDDATVDHTGTELLVGDRKSVV